MNVAFRIQLTARIPERGDIQDLDRRGAACRKFLKNALGFGIPLLTSFTHPG